MKNVYKWLAASVAAMLLLGGCGDAEPELDYESLVVAPVDVAITDCITQEQVSTIIGMPVTLLGVYEDGTQAIYMSEDGAYQANINLKNESRAVFDSNIAALGDGAEMVTSYGEVAYWCSATGELVLYQNGYALGVSVILGDWDVDTTGYVQQIAEIVVNKLQPTE